MDTGVGCAIFAAALAERAAKRTNLQKKHASLLAALVPAAPLLALGKSPLHRAVALCKRDSVSPVLSESPAPSAAQYAGVARAASVAALRYPVNASECGEHWNFFLTLAALVTLTALARVPPERLVLAGEAPLHTQVTEPQRIWCAVLCWGTKALGSVWRAHWHGSCAGAPCRLEWAAERGAGLTVAALHQAALSRGLTGVIHAEERGRSLLSRNKEGVLSLPGYWALSLLSAGVARAVRRSAGAAAAAPERGRLSHGR